MYLHIISIKRLYLHESLCRPSLLQTCLASEHGTHMSYLVTRTRKSGAGVERELLKSLSVGPFPGMEGNSQVRIQLFELCVSTGGSARTPVPRHLHGHRSWGWSEEEEV